MSWIGEFGKIIVKYQDMIEFSLISLAAIAVVILIIFGVVDGHKKRKLLSDIDRTVLKMNSAVASLSQKKADVIYIDNRTPEDRLPAFDLSEATVSNSNEVQTEIPANSPCLKDEQASFNHITTGEKEKTETEALKKYFNRDCGVSKDGMIFTIEELTEKIKE